MTEMSAIGWITRILVIIGALNWGLAIWIGGGVLNNLGLLTTILYALIGLSGVWELIHIFK